MWLRVPEGKTLHVKVGNYKFVGPKEIPLSQKYHLPETFTDGTPIKGYIYDEQSNPDDWTYGKVVGGEKGIGKRKRNHSGSVQRENSVREDSGAGNEPEILCEQLPSTVRSGGGCSKTEDCCNQTEQNPEQDSIGGLSESVLGDDT